MKVAIGITTYNRRKYLESLQRSLYLTENIATCAIHIYDDCSTEFSLDYLYRLFPTASAIIRRTYRLGADANMRQMFIDFLNTDRDVLVTMDADLICRPDWLHFTLSSFDYANGVMSLYNSNCHKSLRQLRINGCEFVVKNHNGAAGSILHRKVIQEIVNTVPLVRGYDLAWSSYLSACGRQILVSKESYFQHIGLLGTHCHGLITEFGLCFRPMHEVNKQILRDYFQEAAQLRRQYLQAMTLQGKNACKI